LPTIGKAKIEFIETPAPFAGKPMNRHEGAPEEQIGSVTKFRVTTTDQLDYVFGIIEWPNASPEVNFIDAVDGLTKYERLQKAGRMGIQTKFGDFWLVELTAMKINPERGWANLAGVTIQKLDEFLGAGTKDLLISLGAFGVGTREALVRDQSKNRNVLSLTCAEGNVELIATAFVITRVLAVMMDYGQSE